MGRGAQRPPRRSILARSTRWRPPPHRTAMLAAPLCAHRAGTRSTRPWGARPAPRQRVCHEPDPTQGPLAPPVCTKAAKVPRNRRRWRTSRNRSRIDPAILPGRHMSGCKRQKCRTVWCGDSSHRHRKPSGGSPSGTSLETRLHRRTRPRSTRFFPLCNNAVVLSNRLGGAPMSAQNCRRRNSNR